MLVKTTKIEQNSCDGTANAADFTSDNQSDGARNDGSIRSVKKYKAPEIPSSGGLSV